MKTDYKIVVDPQYGYRRLDPVPSAADVEKYYAEEFYSQNYQHFNDSQLAVQQNQKEFFELRWQFIRDFCVDHFGSVVGRSLLDVGCGFSQALLYFKSQGFDVFGLDPSVEAVKVGAERNIPVTRSGIEEMPSSLGRSFDVVLLLNVLEHLREPAKALVDIRRRFLKGDGVLAIDVPNEFNDFQVAANELLGLNEWWIQAPVHINYFSPKSLSNLLEQCGYKVVGMQSSFPMEIFLLWNEVYVGDQGIGGRCHEKRVLFEKNLVKAGKLDKLKRLYALLADVELGRQVTVYAAPVGR